MTPYGEVALNGDLLRYQDAVTSAALVFLLVCLSCQFVKYFIINQSTQFLWQGQKFKSPI